MSSNSTSAAFILLLLLGSIAHAQRAQTHYEQLLRGAVPPAMAKPAAEIRYRLETVYHMFTEQGTRSTPEQTVSGDFVFHYSDGGVRWTTVTEATSDNKNAGAVPQTYMQGMTYARANQQSVFSPEFINRFPQNAEKERNLVWDQVMFDSFLDYVDKLKLNEPIKGPSGPVLLGMSGKFENSNIELTWTGITRRNNEDCMLIRFEAFMNHFDITSGNVTVKGRSDYWGEMWVSVRTREILTATLLEEVAGTIQIDQKRLPLQVFRRATLEQIK